jgi:hypothetical protein
MAGLVVVVFIVLVVVSGDRKKAVVVTMSAPSTTLSTTTTSTTSPTAPSNTQVVDTTLSTTTTVNVRVTTTSAPPETQPAPADRSRGQVVDEAGHPLGGMYWELTDDGVAPAYTGVTDADGSYDVPCVPVANGWTWKLLLASQRRQFSYGDPSFNYAYTFVGGGSQFASAPAAPCMTADEPPLVTVMHAGGTLAGQSPGPPDQQDLGFAVRCTCEEQLGFEPSGVHQTYRVVGLPPGDYNLVFNGSSSPVTTVHITAGNTTTYDFG